MAKKKIIFITGTRADFGKIKPLISKLAVSPGFEVFIFVTGMHTLLKYGHTVDEVYKAFPELRMESGFRNIFVYRNQNYGEPMEQILANTIQGFSRYVSELNPDLIIIHGDRVEALAGAIVGSLRNILVAHVEGGELSGTIDELIRHSTSKMSHVHFVSNETAAKRLRQLGEEDDSIFVIGSPEIDLMLSPGLPSFESVKSYYGIPFNQYGVCIFHPVTTDLENTENGARNLVDAILELKEENFVVIYPNNDEGSDFIFREYKRLRESKNVVILPSMRVEYFFTCLRNSSYIIGNSSAGIMEAPVYGVPTLNLANRQKNRYASDSITNIQGATSEIVSVIRSHTFKRGKFQPDFGFGDGRSAERFVNALSGEVIWRVATQKQFKELAFS
jgi:UDP-N-acetylglucosamine 2-epimerase (hydrolysing)